MPTQEGGIKGIYYKLSDKAWALAEWIESKGLPVATFCETHHINPLLLIAVIFLGVLLLVMLALGAFGGVSYGELTVTVTANNVPLSGATVYYEFGGKTESNLTGSSGKVAIKYPIGPEVTLNAKKDGYSTASAKKILDSEKGAASITLSRKSGTLVVNIDVAGGRELPSGTYVVIEATKEVADLANSVGKLPDTKPIISGQSKFENLPAGITLRAYVSLGNQKIPAEGEQATIQEGKTTEISIEVPESSLTTSLEVRVKDVAYQNVDGAVVQLFNWDTGTQIGTPQTTYMGSATISGIILGTSVYATVAPPSGAYSSYNGKTNGDKIDVSREGLPPYEITLGIVGKVEVCVYDEDGLPLNTGNAMLKGTTGQTYQSITIDEECEEFSGLPEGVSIYPVVTASGYQPYGTSADAKTISYSGVTRFTVNMEPLAPGEAVTVYVHVAECETGNPISGIKVKIIDADTYAILDEATTECTGSASVVIPTCGNTVAVVAGGREIYAVAFDDEFQIGKSQIVVAQEGVIMDIITCEADEDNAGDLNVCVYKDGQPFDGASLELYDGDNDLLWTAITDADEDDEDHCYTFKNIPDGETVYARAINIGTSPEVSDTVDIVGGQTANVSIYSGSPPVVLDKGDINVCVRNAETNVTMVANVTVYDHITDQAIIAGATAGGGCRLFEDVAAETNSAGQIIPREIYIIVNRTGYATYNGKDEEAVLDMVPNGRLNINVYLEEAFEICTQVRFSDTDEPADEVTVVLYYNDTADVPITDVETNSNGTARFYEAMRDDYWFKLEDEYTLYDPMDVYEFEQDEVSGGECGIIYLYDLGSLCDLGLEILDNGANFSASIDQPAKIPFRILEDSERGDASASTGSLSSKHEIQLNSGGTANLTLRLNTDYQSFTINYESTEYSADQELVASVEVDEEGQYSGILEVTKNAQCTRQAAFDLNIYEDLLTVTVDDVTFDPVEDTSASFCIYVVDQDSEIVDDATVNVYVDEMDGWAQTATQAAAWNDAQDCYRGRITSSLVPTDDNGDYESGTYIFTVMAERDGIEASAEGSATISPTELCGNGEVDSGEVCDASASTTGCDTDYTCNSDCDECEETECGDTLSVSAGSFNLSIGSGRSGGFCVTVSDTCGAVTTATMTASFSGSGGWPADSTLSASYDTSRSCYYVPITESVAWPSTSTTMTLATINARLGSKTVAVGATEGDRSGSATASGTITCGCDIERWCEAACVCDTDCCTGGATNLNLAGCLTLASQQNYYPTGSTGYNPYSTGSGTGCGSGYGAGTTGASLGASSSGISIGGSGSSISLDWAKCKELFGWGDGGVAGSDANGYVLVNDFMGALTVTGDGPNKAGDCKTLLDHLKGSYKFKYLYVDSPGADDYCCTGNLEAWWGTKCKRDSFDSLLDSASATGDYTIIDIVDLSSSKPNYQGFADIFKVFTSEYTNGGNVLLYDVSGTGGGLYSNSVLFATAKNQVRPLASAKKAAGTKAADQRVWGGFGKVSLEDAKDIWFMSGNGGASLGYPSNTPDSAKTVVITSSQDVANLFLSQAAPGGGIQNAPVPTPVVPIVVSQTPGGVPALVAHTYAVTPATPATPVNTLASVIKGSEKDQAQRPLSDKVVRPGQKTSLYLITDYDTVKTNANSVLSKVATAMSREPMFEEIKASELSYCINGEFQQYPSVTLLKANSGLYIAGVNTDKPLSETICKGVGTPVKLGSAFDTTAAKNVAFAREDNGKYLLMAGQPAKLTDFVNMFRATDGKPDSGSAKVYTLENNGKKAYGLIRYCHEKQVCTLPTGKTQANYLDAAITQDLGQYSTNLPESNVDLSSKIIDCVCRKGKDETVALQLTIDGSSLTIPAGTGIAAAGTILPSEVTVYVQLESTVEGWSQNMKEYKLSSKDVSGSCTGQKCTARIPGVPTTGGKIYLLARFIRGSVCAQTPSGNDVTTLDPETIKNSPTYNVPTMTLAATTSCYGGSQGPQKYTIKGQVIDALDNLVQQSVVGFFKDTASYETAAIFPTSGSTQADGKFSIVVDATPPAQFYVGGNKGELLTSPANRVTTNYLNYQSTGTAGPFGSAGSSQEVNVQNVRIDTLFQLALQGNIYTCNGQKSTAQAVTVTGGTVTLMDGNNMPKGAGTVGVGGQFTSPLTSDVGAGNYKLVYSGTGVPQVADFYRGCEVNDVPITVIVVPPASGGGKGTVTINAIGTTQAPITLTTGAMGIPIMRNGYTGMKLYLQSGGQTTGGQTPTGAAATNCVATQFKAEKVGGTTYNTLTATLICSKVTGETVAAGTKIWVNFAKIAGSGALSTEDEYTAAAGGTVEIRKPGITLVPGMQVQLNYGTAKGSYTKADSYPGINVNNPLTIPLIKFEVLSVKSGASCPGFTAIAYNTGKGCWDITNSASSAGCIEFKITGVGPGTHTRQIRRTSDKTGIAEYNFPEVSWDGDIATFTATYSNPQSGERLTYTLVTLDGSDVNIRAEKGVICR